MDLKSSYRNATLAPVYAGSGSVATVSEDGSIMATPILDDINIIQLKPVKKILHSISNDDEQEITALKVTHDGKYLIFVSQAQLLKIVNVSTGKIIKSMKVSSPSYIIDCDKTSTLATIGGTDGSIVVIDIENGYITHSLKGHGGTISSLKFFGESNRNIWLLCSGDTNGMVKIWDLVKRKCLHTVQEHTSPVRGVDIIESENDTDVLQLVTGGRDSIVNFWEFNLKKKCTLVKTIPAHQQIEASGFINHDFIYTAGSDAVFQVISLQNGQVIKRTRKPIEELFIIGVLPILNGTEYYLVMSDQSLNLIDVQEALEEEEELISSKSCIAGNHGTIADMTFVGPDLKQLALATNSPTLRLVPVPDTNKSGNEDKSFLPIDVDMYEGHEDLLNAIDSTEDGLWIATASKDHSAIVWKYNTKKQKFTQYARFSGHSSSVTAIGLPNVMSKSYPEYLLTASNDLTIKKWKIPKPSTGKEEVEFHDVKVSEYTRRAHEKDINALSISPNDSIFATASYDKTCKIWDLETGESVATLSNHKRGLWDVSFCQFDKIIATCSGDKTIKIWSLDTFSVIKTLEGHTNAVQKCSFINKQNQLVSTGADGLIKIWDISNGECISTLDGHNNRIWALCVQNDGDLIVSADADGVFQFWRDCTDEQREEDMVKEKERIEQEQSLQNYLNEADWTNAFLLAISLDHPMRLFNVLRESLSAKHEADKESIFNKELDHVISTLDDKQLYLLIKRCRDWNTNARTHNVAQRTLRCILQKHNITKLSEIPGVIQLIDGIIPYIQRHFTRIDNLVEQSYILDYALVEMDRLL